MTPEQLRQRAKHAALVRWGRTSTEQRREVTAPGRRAFLERFLREVDGENPGLPERERRKLASTKLDAHMALLALKSSRVRSAKKQSDGS